MSNCPIFHLIDAIIEELSSQQLSYTCLSTRRRHSQIRNEDYGPSIFTCPAHTIDVRRERIPKTVKWKNVLIDYLRLDRTSSVCYPLLDNEHHHSPF